MCTPSGNSEFCFPSSLNVSLDFVSGTVLICHCRGKFIQIKVSVIKMFITMLISKEYVEKYGKNKKN